MTNAIMNKAIVHDISIRHTESDTASVKKNKYFSARVSEIKDRSADAIRDVEVINRVVDTWMTEKKYYRTSYFMFSVNSGLRYSDIVSLRVKDVLDEHGKIVDGFSMIEGKTNNLRSVYFNDAMKEVLEFIIKKNDLKADNFIFMADGNRRKYFLGFEYDSDGNIIDVKTCNEKYDENGNERLRAPITNKTANDWYHDVKKFGAEGHMTSHTARKTFRYFIATSGGKTEENNVLASQCLGHASVQTTLKYYCNITEEMKKTAANSLNLGLNAFRECVKYILI